MLKDDTFITILPFMRNELNLKGNALNIYALIHGFSMGHHGFFCGSIQYIMEWTGASKDTVIEILKKLIDSGLISKKVISKNHTTVYWTNPSRVKCTNKQFDNEKNQWSENPTTISDDEMNRWSENPTTEFVEDLKQKSENPTTEVGKSDHGSRKIRPNINSNKFNKIHHEDVDKRLKEILAINKLPQDVCEKIEILVNESTLDVQDFDGYLNYCLDITRTKNPKNFCGYFLAIVANEMTVRNYLEVKIQNEKDSVKASYECPICGKKHSSGNAVCSCGFNLEDSNDKMKVNIEKQVHKLPREKQIEFRNEMDRQYDFSGMLDIQTLLNPENIRKCNDRLKSIYIKYGINLEKEEDTGRKL